MFISGFQSIFDALRSTEAIDRGKKFASYRQFPTLQEYILVQVDRPGVEVFRRNERGEWVFSDYGIDDRLYLKSVDMEMAVSDVYRKVQFENENEESQK